MHPNPVFRGTPRDSNIAFARARGFGTLAINAEGGPLLAHIPFLINEDASALDLHLVRSNPICRLTPVDAVLSVTGPDAYVSPDWYEADDQVPTWNYISVHLRGTLESLPHEAMRNMLERQSAAYESQLGGKTPWTMDKMSEGVADRMMRMILPFRMKVTAIDGTWKLNQNKDDAARMKAADHMTSSLGSEQETLARLMKSPPLEG
ncbi:MAG: FMN-binding negative transcriptional regulator [Paracoccaceae bacterium]